MVQLRIFWRSLRLLAHLIAGILRAAWLTRRDHGNGLWLPPPEPLSHWLAGLCRLLAVQVEARGAVPHSAALLVCNHISWLDIAVLGSLTHAGFLSKAEVRRWPLIGWLATSVGTLFIHRGAGQAHEVAVAIKSHLLGDRQLAVFPEGTTSDGRTVRPFFPRLFAAAIETGTPVVPISLSYMRDGAPDTEIAYIDDQPFGANLLILLARREVCARVRFHSPIDPRGMDRRTLARAAWEAVASDLASADAPPAQA